MIDLHLHTTASDGLLSPDALVARLIAAGVDTFSVTDHDTVASLAPAADLARRHGLRFIPGIEISAVEPEGDVHMLGYGFDAASPALGEFLRVQRANRTVRVRAILQKLAALGMPIDEASVLSAAADSGRALGRPHVARALIARGFVSTVSQAFDVWLGRGRPAYVPRSGAPAAEVIAIVHAAGGVVSMAHPGLTRRDDLIPSLVSAGLDAIEVWHSDHNEATTERYRALADALGLAMTGGSDFHGDAPDRPSRLGEVVLPPAAFDRFAARLRAANAAAGILDARA